MHTSDPFSINRLELPHVEAGKIVSRKLERKTVIRNGKSLENEADIGETREPWLDSRQGIIKSAPPPKTRPDWILFGRPATYKNAAASAERVPRHFLHPSADLIYPGPWFIGQHTRLARDFVRIRPTTGVYKR